MYFWDVVVVDKICDRRKRFNVTVIRHASCSRKSDNIYQRRAYSIHIIVSSSVRLFLPIVYPVSLSTQSAEDMKQMHVEFVIACDRRMLVFMQKATRRKRRSSNYVTIRLRRAPTPNLRWRHRVLSRPSHHSKSRRTSTLREGSCHSWSSLEVRSLIICTRTAMAKKTVCVMHVLKSGFPRLLEIPGFFPLKYPGPGKFWKMNLVLESPGIYLWFNLTNMPFMYSASAPCVNKCMKDSCCVLTEQFLYNLWWTFCDGLYLSLIHISEPTRPY